jgi:ribosomal protein S18 acetylase RimI-like enzyme
MSTNTIFAREDGIQVLRCTSPDDMDSIVSSFIDAYLHIFSEAPYFEQFFPEEVQAILEQNLRAPENITLFAIDTNEPNNPVIGFSFAIPVIARPDVSRQLRGLLPIRNTFYFSELGITPKYRRRGLGKLLTNLRIEHIDIQKYTHVVLRTSIEKDASQEMYQKMHFEDMGVYCQVTSRKNDGELRTDKRLFLSRLLEATR